MDNLAAIRATPPDEKLSVEEVKRRYPNEWVALRDIDVVDTIVTAGVVYAHHPDRDAFHKMAWPLNGGAIFWTGRIRGRLSWE